MINYVDEKYHSDNVFSTDNQQERPS